MEPQNDGRRSNLNQWLAALDDPDWNTRATAVRMLGELGELTPLGPLLTALSDEDESVRAATVRALGKQGKHVPIDRLVVTLSDPSWIVREMAALTLGELGEQAPTEPLLDILRTEHEDVFVREAAKMALSQAHPEMLPTLVEQANGVNHAEDHYVDRRERHHAAKSSPAWLNGFAKHFSNQHTEMQNEDDFVEMSDLDVATHSNSPLPPPVSVSSRRHLSLRIAEGALIALLILGIGFSWLVLAQKLRQPAHISAKPTPTPSPTVLPSGQGYDVSLAVVNGMVDVGTMDNIVYALRASDGSLLWRYNTAGPVSGPVGSPPVVVDGIVYVNANIDQGLGYSTGYIYALRASDGVLLWRYTTGNFVYHGYLYSPTVANGAVYITSQSGSLTTLRASDGALLWTSTNASFLTAVQGVVYIFITNIDQGPNYLGALRASDGKLLWRISSYDYPPVVVNDVVYITSQAGLSALRARDGALLWRYTLAGTEFAEPTIFDGMVYTIATNFSPETTASIPTVVDAWQVTTSAINWNIPYKQEGPSSLYALRASDGSVLWHYQTPSDKNNGMGVLAVAGGLVYIDTTVDQSKDVISALRASDGSVLWTHASDATSNWAVVRQGVIYIASNSDVVSALQAQNGKELWRYNVSGNVYSSPVLDGSTLYIGVDNGMIYALDASNGSLRWQYVTNTGS